MVLIVVIDDLCLGEGGGIIGRSGRKRIIEFGGGFSYRRKG